MPYVVDKVMNVDFKIATHTDKKLEKEKLLTF